MRDQKLVIKIEKPVKDVFDFCINPQNTPKWINFVVTEQASDWPPKLGTIYRNQTADGEWRELTVTDFEENRKFVLSDNNGFHIQYAFTSIDNDTTQLGYYIWMDKGELRESLTMDILEKLKMLIENQY